MKRLVIAVLLVLLSSTVYAADYTLYGVVEHIDSNGETRDLNANLGGVGLSVSNPFGRAMLAGFYVEALTGESETFTKREPYTFNVGSTVVHIEGCLLPEFCKKSESAFKLRSGVEFNFSERTTAHMGYEYEGFGSEKSNTYTIRIGYRF